MDSELERNWAQNEIEKHGTRGRGRATQASSLFSFLLALQRLAYMLGLQVVKTACLINTAEQSWCFTTPLATQQSTPLARCQQFKRALLT